MHLVIATSTWEDTSLTRVIGLGLQFLAGTNKVIPAVGPEYLGGPWIAKPSSGGIDEARCGHALYYVYADGSGA